MVKNRIKYNNISLSRKAVILVYGVIFFSYSIFLIKFWTLIQSYFFYLLKTSFLFIKLGNTSCSCNQIGFLPCCSTAIICLTSTSCWLCHLSGYDAASTNTFQCDISNVITGFCFLLSLEVSCGRALKNEYAVKFNKTLMIALEVNLQANCQQLSWNKNSTTAVLS